MAILRGIWTLIVWTWWIIIPIILYYAWKNLRKAKYVEQINHLVLSIKIPKNNDKGPVAAEMMFASLHGILQPKKARNSGEVVQDHLSFEIVATTNAIEFFVWTPEHLRDFVEGQVYAQYPTAEISLVEDYTKSLDIDDDKVDESVAGTELSLVKSEIYPIKTFQNFDVDPLAGITGMLSKLDGGSEKVWIQVLAMPVDDNWRQEGIGYIGQKKNGSNPNGRFGTEAFQSVPNFLYAIMETIFDGFSWFIYDFLFGLISGTSGGDKKKEVKKDEKAKLSHPEEVELTAIEEKANKLGFGVKIRIVYLADSTEKAKERIQAVVGAFKQFNTTNLNGFQGDSVYTGIDFLNSYRARLMTQPVYTLNIEELASLYHLPHVSVETPNIVWTSSKKGEPPSTLAYINDLEKVNPGITPLARTTHRGSLKAFGIKREDRLRHMYVIGKSGTGKSRLLEYQAISDIKRGEGVGIIDPHGELIDRVLKYIPRERINDVVYFNPADRDNPIAFNPLEATPEFREEVTNGFVSVLKKQFGYSWGPRLEYVLKHTVAALVEVEGSTMLGIVRLLTDKNYRKKIVEQVTDPVVQMFWLKEFAAYNDKMATETIAPILNKVGQFTASPIIRNIVGQPHSKIDFGKLMNEKKILLVDLSTGKIGEANSELLGSMIITKLQLAAMSRAFIPENERKDFYLYVDEFQNFATESFGVILSEARKYRLSLNVANQYVAQMDEAVRDAVFGNVGTLVSFRIGATDAAFLEKEFLPVFEQNDLINLDNRHAYLNMLIDGVTSIPFSAVTIDSPEITEDLSAAIKAVSRETYGSTRESVESSIRQWYNVDSVIAGVNANEQGNKINPTTANNRNEGSFKDNQKLDQQKTLKTERPNNNLKNAISEALTKKETVENQELKSQITSSVEKSETYNSKPELKKEIVNEPLKGTIKIEKVESYRSLAEKKEEIKDEPKHHQERKTKEDSYKAIGKDTLSNIIREVTKPKNQPIEANSPIAKSNNKPQTEIKHQHEYHNIANIKERKSTNILEKERGVREITPEEFHKLKEIHPHERIKIKRDAQEIKPGEIVKF
ncbi:MAG: type IV secretion system DNA-binding domain-containing protein [Patescibacteria group bacterium]|nr:type IV secretion system DNA-binding domain-containing protein [Patescibacteria group bacterium]